MSRLQEWYATDFLVYKNIKGYNKHNKPHLTNCTQANWGISILNQTIQLFHPWITFIYRLFEGQCTYTIRELDS